MAFHFNACIEFKFYYKVVYNILARAVYLFLSITFFTPIARVLVAVA